MCCSFLPFQQLPALGLSPLLCSDCGLSFRLICGDTTRKYHIVFVLYDIKVDVSWRSTLYFSSHPHSAYSLLSLSSNVFVLSPSIIGLFSLLSPSVCLFLVCLLARTCSSLIFLRKGRTFLKISSSSVALVAPCQPLPPALQPTLTVNTLTTAHVCVDSEFNRLLEGWEDEWADHIFSAGSV